MMKRGWRSLGWAMVLSVTWALWGGVDLPLWSQPEQVVEVTIKDFKFLTKQGTLRLGVSTVIKVKNEDAERHDFGSTMFEGIPTQVERDGVVVYGRGGGRDISRCEARGGSPVQYVPSRPP